MKKIVLAVIMVLMMVGVASAQVKLSDASVGSFGIDVVPYVDIRAWSDSQNADPLVRYGVRIEANNIFLGTGFYVAVEGGKIDTEDTDVATSCNDPDGCVWPKSFINEVKNGKSYTAIWTGVQWKLNVFGK